MEVFFLLPMVELLPFKYCERSPARMFQRDAAGKVKNSGMQEALK
jgi:hypothetical protein